MLACDSTEDVFCAAIMSLAPGDKTCAWATNCAGVFCLQTPSVTLCKSK